MPINFYMYFVVALLPMIIGFIYYNPMVMGNAWMKSNNFTAESLEKGNMAVILGVSYLFSVMLSFFLGGLVIHQSSIFGLLVPEVMESGSAAQQAFTEFMEKYGDRHRTFSHGAVHGFFSALFFVLPLIGINALFERRGWKYILIHFVYWLITLVLMGGGLCATLKYAALT